MIKKILNKYKKLSSGFTSIELLVTLFIAAAFLTTGYQLFSLIVNDSGESSSKSVVSGIVYDYLQKYKSYTTNPCTASTPLTTSLINNEEVPDAKVSVEISCPYPNMPSISKILVTVNYNNSQQTVSNATFHRPTLECPTGFIPVPGSPTYKTTDFCVMKYEAKSSSNGDTVSTPSGLPTVNIPQKSSTAVNVSQGKTASSTSLVDGVVTSSPYYSLSAGLKSVIVDLGAVYAISSINVRHYFADTRIYNATKTEVSADNINWTTVFDSTISGTYAESASGRTTTFPEMRVRYIRDWLNGSNVNTGNHWVEIQAFEKSDAINKSIAACDGCHLITDAEWLTIAQNIASVPSNWPYGIVGTGYIFSGHNDNSPANPLVASLDDNNGYYATGNTSGNQKRTLTLTNGEVIWDFAGNVSEYTSNQASSLSQPGKASQTAYEWTQWDVVTNIGSMPVNSSPVFANPIASSWNTAKGIGAIYTNPSATTVTSVTRGGSWATSTNAGIYSMNLSFPASTSSPSIGFRVAK